MTSKKNPFRLDDFPKIELDLRMPQSEVLALLAEFYEHRAKPHPPKMSQRKKGGKK